MLVSFRRRRGAVAAVAARPAHVPFDALRRCVETRWPRRRQRRESWSHFFPGVAYGGSVDICELRWYDRFWEY